MERFKRYLGVELGEKQADLLEDCAWCPLRKLREEFREMSGPFGILRAEALRGDFTQNLIPQLCVVELPKQYVEALRHGLREMLVVLEGLHDGGLCCGSVAVMFDGKADDFVDAEFDRLGLHVLFTLGDVIRWRGETPTTLHISGFVVIDITHPINVSLSPLTVQILDVFSFRTLLIRVSMGTIWSFHDHSGALFFAAALGCAAFPPRPLRDFAGAPAAGASS